MGTLAGTLRRRPRGGSAGSTPIPLTQTLVVNAQPREKMYRFFDGPALYLEATPIT
jgi:hypothetical protein